MARPTKLTPELIVEIAGYIRAGNWPATAAQAAGISLSTYYRWLAVGEKEEEGQIHRDFLLAIRQAEAEAEVEGIAGLRTMSFDSFAALKFFLERRFPHWRHDAVPIPLPSPDPATIFHPRSRRLTDVTGDAPMIYREPAPAAQRSPDESTQIRNQAGGPSTLTGATVVGRPQGRGTATCGRARID
jgi:hypothetical protein